MRIFTFCLALSIWGAALATASAQTLDNSYEAGADIQQLPVEFSPAQVPQDPTIAPDLGASKYLGDDVGPYRQHYFQGDGLYWGRVGGGCNQVLALNTNLAPILQSDDLKFNGAGGARFLLGWTPDPCRCSRCCAFELSYFGIYNWQAHGQLTGPGNLAIPGDLGLASNNFFGANILDYNYRSSLNNIELNCIKSCCFCDAKIDFLCGLRFISVNERYTITGTDFQEGTSSYDVEANNYLYGGQLGGRYTRYYGLWSLQLVGKAGVFLNDANQSQQATDFPTGASPFFLRNRVGADGTSVAALGELGVTAIRPINDTWSMRMGYMALGLGGLALAPDQLDFTDTPTSGTHLNQNGWIFAHGLVLGLEAHW
jgi:hypothetical protein